jgi:hypothetical protein
LRLPGLDAEQSTYSGRLAPRAEAPTYEEANTLQPLWDQLVGEDLSGVVFVRDYLQLQLNPPPQVNVYSACVVVSANGATAKFGEEPFANLILSHRSRCQRSPRGG